MCKCSHSFCFASGLFDRGHERIREDSRLSEDDEHTPMHVEHQLKAGYLERQAAAAAAAASEGDEASAVYVSTRQHERHGKQHNTEGGSRRAGSSTALMMLTVTMPGQQLGSCRAMLVLQHPASQAQAAWLSQQVCLMLAA
jgi:hypothetical protein